MEEHVCKLCGLQQELNAHSQLITDVDFTNTLLTSLPDSQSPFITAENAGGATLTSDILIVRLLDEDQAHQAGMAQQIALKVQSCDDSGAIKGKCCNCSKKGHYVSDCWVEGGGKEGQAPTWYKSKNNDTIQQAEDNGFAFMADDTALISISAPDWLADLAATTHIV